MGGREDSNLRGPLFRPTLGLTHKVGRGRLRSADPRTLKRHPGESLKSSGLWGRFFVQKSRDGPRDPRCSARIRGGEQRARCQGGARWAAAWSLSWPRCHGPWLLVGVRRKKGDRGLRKSPGKALGLTETSEVLQKAIEMQKHGAVFVIVDDPEWMARRVT